MPAVATVLGTVLLSVQVRSVRGPVSIGLDEASALRMTGLTVGGAGQEILVFGATPSNTRVAPGSVRRNLPGVSCGCRE